MPTVETNNIDAPFRDVGFRKPSVIVQEREPGVLILKSGRQLPSLPGCTTDWLAHWSAERPDSLMLAQRNASGDWSKLTCRQVWNAVQAIASKLLQYSTGQPGSIAILSENSIEQALLTWGALHAGVPVAPISPSYSLLAKDFSRLKAAVDLIAPAFVFVQDAQSYAAAIEALGIASDRILTVDRPGRGMQLFSQWLDTPSHPHLAAHHHGLSGDAPAKFMFTSGSTGMPKAVVQTRSMLAAAQEMTTQVFEQAPAHPPVYLEWLPWHHVMGGNIVLNRILRFGATLYIDNGRPAPGRFGQTLQNLREIAPSLYFNVPAGLTMLIDELERDEAFARHFFSRLTYIYYGGAVLARKVYDRYQALAIRLTGKRIVLTSVYGATETCGPGITQYWGADEVGCIGLPLSDIELKLVEDKSVPGRYELRIRGPNILREYHLAPAQTSQAFDEEGYYLTGDAVRFVDPANPVAGLRFAGRFAEDFKLASGTWVRTAAVRMRLLEACAPLLKDVVIATDGVEAIGALAWPDPAACAAFLSDAAQSSLSKLQKHPALLEELNRRLQLANQGQTGSSMRVQRLALLAEPASLETYELTDKGSINQRAVLERRAADVATLFADPCPEHVVSASSMKFRDSIHPSQPQETSP